MALPDDPVHVPRVLDVQKGKLCYIVGTVYMDMPLKPNVLVDLGKEVRFSRTTRHF
jgi:DNA polymerase delta subunit 2